MSMRTIIPAALGVLLASAASQAPAAAQTDFYNLDKDRPLRVEDAYAKKQFAWEWKAVPLALSQLRDGTVRYAPELELAVGLLPGLEVSAGFGMEADRSPPSEPRRARTELELSSLLNLTTETRWLPALGVRVTGHLPVQGDGPRSLELRGVATRGLGGPIRAHLNGAYIFTEELVELHEPFPEGRAAHGPAEQWWAGLAVDYVLPFRHTLLVADTWVSEREAFAGDDESGRTVQSTIGFRHQLSPTLAMDAGVGRAWTGPEGPDWRLGMGLAYEFGVRALMPGSRDGARAGSPGRTAPRTPARPGSPVERVYHPMYLPASHNWEFRARYPAVDRLFAAFDFGHGILYETLWTRPNAPTSLLEDEIYDRLTRDILVDPPRMHMPEQSFMSRYARLVPLAKEMFEWAHILHRQTYDILADDRIADKDAAMAELLDYYFTSPLAFTDVPKGMAIMDEQHFSKEFRQQYPKFNGLIWAYHWLQVAVYEPLLLHDSPEERQAAMNALLARFWQMLEDPPTALPSEMPMTPAIAPEFTARYPRFAAVFDNLHMMHDVISDILVSERVSDKRAEIYRQADLFRDPGAVAVTRDEWIRMALAHGLDAQGGPAMGILGPAPTAGAQGHHPAGHQHDAAGHQHDAAGQRHDAAGHQHDPAGQHRHHAPAPAADTTPAVHHHPPAPAGREHGMPMMHDPGMHRAMELVVRLLDDATVQRRIHAVPELHEGWEDAEVQEHLAMMRRMHGPEAEHPADHDRPHHDHDAMQIHPEPGPRPGMRRAMGFVVRLLADPEVQRRIHAVHAYHEAWEDPAVQRHFDMMRARVEKPEQEQETPPPHH
jgi:hypothetical protein